MSSTTAEYRYEIKFVVNEIRLAEFYRWLWARTTMRVAYPDRVINSLYFDDTRFQCVRDNLSGLPDREKFRIRWYSNAGNDSVNGLKLEKKVRKGRVGCKQTASLDRLRKGFLDQEVGLLGSAALNEFVELGLMAGQLQKQIFPSLHVNYGRQYLQDADGIRITIDSDISFYPVNACEKLFSTRPLPFSKKVIEFKFDPALKNKVARMMKPLHLVPQRNSKYLQGMAMNGMAVYL